MLEKDEAIEQYEKLNSYYISLKNRGLLLSIASMICWCVMLGSIVFAISPVPEPGRYGFGSIDANEKIYGHLQRIAYMGLAIVMAVLINGYSRLRLSLDAQKTPIRDKLLAWYATAKKKGIRVDPP